LATLDRISFLELFSFTEGSDARLALHSKVAGAMGEGGRAAWRKAKTRWIRNDGAGKGREAWAPYLVDDAAYTRAGRIVAKAIGEGRVSFVRADLREIAHSDAAADCSVAVLSNVPEHMAARLSELAFRSGRPDPGPGAVGWADAKRRRLLDAHLGSVVPLLSRMPEGGRMMASYLYKAANLLGGDLDPARAAAVLGLKDAAGAAVSVRRCRHTLTSRGDAALLVVKKAEKGGEERRG